MAVTRPVRKRVTNQVYVQGNAARQLQPQREMIPERLPERQRRPQSRPVHHPREQAVHMEVPYLIALAIAACCTLYICVSYLHLQSDLTMRLGSIQKLEQELEVLRSENDALETSINTHIDLDYVYNVATEKLGMVYAGKDQVLLYNKTESEYVRQYEDIPAH